MTLEELAKALGLDGEEQKDKFTTLKKEYNALSKAAKESQKKVEALEAEAQAAKDKLDKFDIVVKAYELDLESEDFDAMLDDKKDAMIKAAGGGATPDEIKILKRDLTKAQRELSTSTKQVNELTEQLNVEKTQRINGVKKDAVQKALTQNNVIKPDQFISLFMDKVEVDKDGVTVTMKDSAGNELSVADAVADWAKDNPEFIKKDTLGGLGSGGGQGSKLNIGVTDFMQSFLAKNGSQGGQDVAKSLVEMFG